LQRKRYYKNTSLWQLHSIPWSNGEKTKIPPPPHKKAGYVRSGREEGGGHYA